MSYITLEQVSKRYSGANKLSVNNIDLHIEQGEIVSLLGPSGCGKTTTLRMIAGFETPLTGCIRIAGEIVWNAQISIPPERRGVGMVFQDYALFPHLTVEKNVIFGLLKWSALDKLHRAREVLTLVGLEDYADRYPHELSGGQQQRVALARALAPKPKVILMDEPFSNLDSGLRERMRVDVQEILRKSGTTALIVTHDQRDALAVSDRVVVMNEGVIQQIATPKEMYLSPKNSFVAQFVGKTNLLEGTVAEDLKHVYTGIGKVCLAAKTTGDSERRVTVSVRPESCKLAATGRYKGRVEHVLYSGEHQELQLSLDAGIYGFTSMLIYAPTEQYIVKGDQITFDISPDLVALVD